MVNTKLRQMLASPPPTPEAMRTIEFAGKTVVLRVPSECPIMEQIAYDPPIKPETIKSYDTRPIYPIDNYDYRNHNIVCCINDPRIWQDHVSELREKRLRELGVAPRLTETPEFSMPFIPSSIIARSASAGNPHLGNIFLNSVPQHKLSVSLTHPITYSMQTPEDISAQIAALKVKQHALSSSISLLSGAIPKLQRAEVPSARSLPVWEEMEDEDSMLVHPASNAPDVDSDDLLHQDARFSANATEFVPFSREISIPSPRNKAVPIVLPQIAANTGIQIVPENVIHSECTKKHNTLNLSHDEFKCEAEERYDAYDGFDSDAASNGASSVLEPESDARVRSFKFPSQPSSPQKKSFPCKTKAIEDMSDGELDSIIMDLSIREIGAKPFLDSDVSDQETDEERSSNMFDKARGLRQDYVASVKKNIPTNNRRDISSNSLRRVIIETMRSELRPLGNKHGSVNDMRQRFDNLKQKLMDSEEICEKEEYRRKEAECTLDEVRADLSSAKQDLEHAWKEAAMYNSQLQKLQEERNIRQTSVKEAEVRTNVLEGARKGLQSSVGDLTAKCLRLQTELVDQRKQQVALQQDLDRSNDALALSTQNLATLSNQKDCANQEIDVLRDRYGRLERDMQETATAIVEEQHRWISNSKEAKERIESLERRLSREEHQKSSLLKECDKLRFEERVLIRAQFELEEKNKLVDRLNATVQEMRLNQGGHQPDSGISILTERIRNLEAEKLEARERNQRDITSRDERLDRMLDEWKAMAAKLHSSEQAASQLPRLQNELVTLSHKAAEANIQVVKKDEEIEKIEKLVIASDVQSTKRIKTREREIVRLRDVMKSGLSMIDQIVMLSKSRGYNEVTSQLSKVLRTLSPSVSTKKVAASVNIETEGIDASNLSNSSHPLTPLVNQI